MPKSNLLFRANPPRELILRILGTIGLGGLGALADFRWFSKKELELEGIEEWLAELEAYYYPCKARRFFYGRGEPSADWIISVLRHLLPLEGYVLKAQERVYKDQKQTLYQISPLDLFKDLSGASLTVDFV